MSIAEQAKDVVANAKQSFGVVVSANQIASQLDGLFSDAASKMSSLSAKEKSDLCIDYAILNSSSPVESREFNGTTLVYGKDTVGGEESKLCWIISDDSLNREAEESINQYSPDVVIVFSTFSHVDCEFLNGMRVNEIDFGKCSLIFHALIYDEFTQEFLNTLVSMPGAKQALWTTLEKWGLDQERLLTVSRKSKERYVIAG